MACQCDLPCTKALLEQHMFFIRQNADGSRAGIHAYFGFRCEIGTEETDRSHDGSQYKILQQYDEPEPTPHRGFAVTEAKSVALRQIK